MTYENVVAMAIVQSISERSDPVSWSARAWSGTAHRNNLGSREKNRPFLSCAFIDRLVLSPGGAR